MDADKRTAKKKLCKLCVLCVTRTWAERIFLFMDIWYLQRDTSRRFEHSSGACSFHGWLTIDTVCFAEHDGFWMSAGSCVAWCASMR